MRWCGRARRSTSTSRRRRRLSTATSATAACASSPPPSLRNRGPVNDALSLGVLRRIKEQVDVRHTCKRDWKLDDVQLTEDQVTWGRNREQILKDAFWLHAKMAQGGEWAERKRAQQREQKRGGKRVKVCYGQKADGQ